MNPYLINPYIRKAKNSVLLNPSFIRTRSILDYELLYIKNGHFQLVYNGVAYDCHKGNLMLLHPGVEHYFRSLGESIEQPHIHFDLCYDESSLSVPVSFKSLDKMTPKERMLMRKDELTMLGPSPFLAVSNMEAFLNLFFSLIDEFWQTAGKQSTLAVRSKMLQLLNMIFADNCPELLFDENSDSHLPEIEEVKNYIDANYRTEITLKSLQMLFYYSRSFLEKKFCECYGIPVMHYCKQVKLEKAKKMLKTRSVTEVAEELSFSSIFAFSRAFKNTYGISPQAYQKTLTE